MQQVKTPWPVQDNRYTPTTGTNKPQSAPDTNLQIPFLRLSILIQWPTRSQLLHSWHNVWIRCYSLTFTHAQQFGPFRINLHIRNWWLIPYCSPDQLQQPPCWIAVSPCPPPVPVPAPPPYPTLMPYDCHPPQYLSMAIFHDPKKVFYTTSSAPQASTFLVIHIALHYITWYL